MSESFKLEYLPRLPEKKEYGIGIVGSGFIVKECHLPAYREAGYRVVGITSRNVNNAKRTADEFGIPQVYENVQEMLADPDIEVVDIAVPPHEQPMIIREAARHGKHILAQKPLAINMVQARELVAFCKEAGVQLVVNQNGRFDPAILATKALLEQGYVGKPVVATIELRFKPHWQPYQQEYERLMFLFMSIHHLDQFRFWFGTPDLIYASAAPHPAGQFKGDYIGSYILEYDSGLRASAWDDGFTWDPEGFGVFYKIEGTEGVVKMNIGWPHGGPSTLRFYSKRLADQWYSPELEGSWFPGAFRYTMGELFRQIETGVPSAISGENNLETMAMVEACYLSSREKRAVSIAEILHG
ncbi:Gfo/Idh/MocA family oxidoreductase [Brevibacillus sp. SYP-B805]|nr:Gfo/Idh/MocA family oxidoreductase [Brevibacillus sp. SYP-B805]